MSTLTVASISGPASNSYIMDVASLAILRSAANDFRVTGIQTTGGTNMIDFNNSTNLCTLEARTRVVAAYSEPINMNNSMSGNTITWNLDASNNFFVNVPGSTTWTLGTPSNMVDGKSGIIMVALNGSSNMNFAGSTFVFKDGTAPSFSGSTLNILAYYVQTDPRNGNRRIVIIPTLNMG